jgi:hypothetical protein
MTLLLFLSSRPGPRAELPPVRTGTPLQAIGSTRSSTYLDVPPAAICHAFGRPVLGLQLFVSSSPSCPVKYLHRVGSRSQVEFSRNPSPSHSPVICHSDSGRRGWSRLSVPDLSFEEGPGWGRISPIVAVESVSLGGSCSIYSLLVQLHRLRSEASGIRDEGEGGGRMGEGSGQCVVPRREHRFVEMGIKANTK